MARSITCDICQGDVNPHETITVRCRDGEHPHNGSTMYTVIDCCTHCIIKITDLNTNQELHDLQKKFGPVS